MKSIALSTAVLCAVSTFGYAQSATPQERNREQASQQESRNDPEHARMRCAREDMAGNQFEIQAGQIAQQKSQNRQVRDLAMHIADDHQKAQQQLRQACNSSDSQAPELNAVQQAKIDELQKKQGEEFDRCFLFGMVGDHEQDLLMYRWQADHAPDTNIQKYAREQIPVLEQHLKMARAAADAYLGTEAREAGEHMRGTNSLNNATSAGHDSHNFSSQPNDQGAGAPGGAGTDRTTHR